MLPYLGPCERPEATCGSVCDQAWEAAASPQPLSSQLLTNPPPSQLCLDHELGPGCSGTVSVGHGGSAGGLGPGGHGGCAGGGGQPLSSDPESVQHVAETLIQIDQNSAARKPRTNMKLNHIYAEFLKAPFGEKSQDLLQTVYTKRGRY